MLLRRAFEEGRIGVDSLILPSSVALMIHISPIMLEAYRNDMVKTKGNDGARLMI